MSTFVELEKQVQENAKLTRRVADLEADVRRLTEERNFLRELVPSRDLREYAEWTKRSTCGCGRTDSHFRTRASGCTPRTTAVDQ